MVINAGGAEKRGAVAAFEGTCRAPVTAAANATVRISGAKEFEAVAESLPELKRAHGAFASETAHLEPREAANKDRPARPRHDASISQGERPS